MADRERLLRVAVIGCGWFSYNHLHAWREIPEVELVAVCDRDAARARDAAEAHRVPAWYEDADAMLDAERLDFVDVVTTPPSHRPLVEAVARRGLPVICQKPLAIGLDDARAMVAACRDAGVPLMVHENFRWQSPMRAARRLLDEGAVGRPFFGRISWRTARDVFAVQPYLATEPHLILTDIGVHLLDLARFYFGEPRALACQTLRIRPHIAGEDAATLLLEFDNASCILDCSYSSYAPEDLYPQQLLHIEGTEGTVDVGPHYRLSLARSDGTVEEREVAIHQYPWSTPPIDAAQDSVVAIQRHWVACLRNGQPPETSGEDNLRTLELVDGAYAAAAAGTIYRPTRGEGSGRGGSA